MEFTEQHRATHVGSDILDRLPAEVREEVEAQLPDANTVQAARRWAYKEVSLL